MISIKEIAKHHKELREKAEVTFKSDVLAEEAAQSREGGPRFWGTACAERECGPEPVC